MAPYQVTRFPITWMVKNNEFPFLEMKMSCSPKGNLQFVVFMIKGQQLKYAIKESTHTPSTLRAISSGFLNRPAKLTSRTPSLHYEGVDKVYPDHANALCKAGLAPPNFPTMGDLWKIQDKTLELQNEKEPEIIKKEKQKCLLLWRLFTLLFYVYIHSDQQAKHII